MDFAITALDDIGRRVATARDAFHRGTTAPLSWRIT
ncbi:MAG: hypothetical protein RLY45_2388, partial [Actinomycetota bacterium]